jgi:hypothetical protein
MNPGMTTNGTVQWPETDYMKVTCIFPSSGTNPCSEWTFEPNGIYIAPDMTVKERNVTKLTLVVAGQHGAVTEVNHGDFYFSFQIVLMK